MSEAVRYYAPGSPSGVVVSADTPLPIHSYAVMQALRQISDTYGDTALVKPKPLRKFGRNEAVSTARTTIMTLPTGIAAETLPTTNAITTMVSSSASDTQNLTLLEGHTVSGTDLTFTASTTATALTGLTGAALPVSLTRATRARLASPAVGDIYFYEGGAVTSGVPNDLTTVHMMIPAGEIQTQKCSTAISSQDYWIITSFTAGLLEKVGSWAQARIEIKPWTSPSTAFYPVTEWVAVSDASGSRDLIKPGDPAVIVPPNHDVRVSSSANTTGVDVVAGISGWLALIQ